MPPQFKATLFMIGFLGFCYGIGFFAIYLEYLDCCG